MIKCTSSCPIPLWASSSSHHDRSCSTTVAQKRRPGRLVRINAVSLISYCFLLAQLLFAKTSARTAVSASNDERDSQRRLGAPTFDLSDEDFPISATCDYEEHEINELYDKVKDNLRGLGYSVKEGNYSYAEKKIAINNPGNPYLTYLFEDNNGLTPPSKFKLKPSSAVMFLGCTPRTLLLMKASA